MDNLNIIDQFMQTFARYLDSGFGLLTGDVIGLSSILIGIDVTLAALWWAVDRDADLLIRLIRKVLYVGAFAYILNNFSTLASLIFSSFARLGLDAVGSGLSAADLMLPGKLAGTGFSAAWPLLQQAGSLLGVTTFFTNFITIIVLLTAWFIVVVAFFILAIQLFITVLEYKLTCLAGFTLVPFAFWNKTSFLAERVLGNVVSSGVKVMVLAIIVGIGSTLFSTFTSAAPAEPTIASAMSLVLAALTFLGLGIFGPTIATGLVAGAPQLGAGAVIGTAGAALGGAMLVGGAAGGATALASGGLGALRAGAALGGRGDGPPSGSVGPPPSGPTPGGSGMTSGASSSSASPSGSEGGALGASPASTAKSRSSGGSGGSGGSGPPSPETSSEAGGAQGAEASNTETEGAAAGAPPWARRLSRDQRSRDARRAITDALKAGDSPGAPANPDLDQEE